MSIKKDILTLMKFGFIVLTMLITIGFTNSKQDDKYIKDVVIDIDNQYENYFIDQKDVLGLINKAGKDYLLGSDYGSLSLKELENRILDHKFVSKVQAYRDLQGVLTIKVEQNRPIARVLLEDGNDVYISTTGEILPQSEHYTARVMLLTVPKGSELLNQNMLNSEEGVRIFDLIRFIDEDEFWKAQIAGMQINEEFEVQLIPQVTKQTVEFGKAEEIETKFKKLKIFYKQILPYEGWNTYSSVNLKYKEQIVCK